MERHHPKSRLLLARMAAAALGGLLAGPVLLDVPAHAAQGANAATVPAISAPVLAHARKSLLRLTDMPKGWTASPSSPGSNSAFPGTAALAHCLRVAPAQLRVKPPAVNSPTFTSPNHFVGVLDSVSIFPNPAAARRDYATVANPRMPACLQQAWNGAGKPALEKLIGSGLTLNKITVGRLAPTEIAGHGASIKAAISLTAGGKPLKVVLLIIAYLKGSEAETVTFFAVNTGVPARFVHRLTTLAAARL